MLVGCESLRLRLVGLRLIARPPFVVRHAIDMLTRLCLADRDAFFRRAFLHPARQAISAEARQIHHVDVLHVSARTQMLDQLAEGRRFNRNG